MNTFYLFPGSFTNPHLHPASVHTSLHGVEVKLCIFAQAKLRSTHAFCNTREKNMYDSVNKLSVGRFCWNSGSPSGKVTFDRCSKMWSTHSSDVCCPRSEWKYWMERWRLFMIRRGFCQGNKHEGKKPGCLESDVNTRHLDETPSSTHSCTLRRRERFLKTVCHLHFASKFVQGWHAWDIYQPGTVNDWLQLSFAEHSPNCVYKDSFSPKITRCRFIMSPFQIRVCVPLSILKLSRRDIQLNTDGFSSKKCKTINFVAHFPWCIM